MLKHFVSDLKPIANRAPRVTLSGLFQFGLSSLQGKQQTPSTKIIALLFFAFLLAASNPAISQNELEEATEQTPTSTPGADYESEAATSGEQAVIEQLELLITNIKDRKENIDRLRQQIKASTIEAQTTELQQTLEEEQGKLLEQQNLFEELATGAADVSLFRTAEEKAFSWQSEVEDVVRPILSELKKITEKPRQLEALRTQEEALATRLQAAEIAVAEIDKVLEINANPELDTQLNQLQRLWIGRRDDLNNSLQLVQYQLQEREANAVSKSELIIAALKDFFTGRGLNLLLAILAFSLTFVSVRFIGFRIANALAKDPDKERRLASRLLHVIFQMLTVLFAFFIMMATLYALGDWLLLTLLIILIVGLVFALRNSLPRYADEVRFLLNMGSAREGERVIYEGIPYKISRLNLRSDLINPNLRGGHLQLPLKIMMELVSRPWADSEPWFPSKINHYVLLTDGTYGKVLMQSPEAVELQLPGGDTKIYPCTDYLSLSPQNLSEKFGIYLTFGLDYSHQQKITSEIPLCLKEELQAYLANESWWSELEKINVEFKEASASSLDLLIMLDFKGEAAAAYPAIKRKVQKAIVDACNKHHWIIPFNQLTVHMAAADDA